MTRPPRPDFAGAIHHVYARGAVKQRLYLDRRDRRVYLGMLEWVIEKMSWHCLSYCLMGTHMHLLIEPPEPTLSRGMHRLHGAFAQAYNRRHKQAGHVFDARFKATLVGSDAQLWVTAGYIARNPVEAGLCTSPEAWPWGSHAYIADGTTPPCVNVDRLLSFFAPMGGDPRRRYLEFVAARPPKPS